jgi:VWFA-related protein
VESPSSQATVGGVRTELVQVDAIVTDAHGKQPTDLSALDFEIKEDGRSQEITHFACILARPADSPSSQKISSASPQAVAGASGHPDVAMAFVVDDLSLSLESVVRVRHLLTTFVERQMRSGDLVAIVRTSIGLGPLQQFTSDKRLLRSAISSIRFTLAHRQPAQFNLPLPTELFQGSAAASAVSSAAARLDALDKKIGMVLAEHSTAGTLGALHFVFRSLKELPGRKYVVLLSEGISLQDADGQRSPLLTKSLERATDAANRAAAVVYSIDPSGLRPGPLSGSMESYLDQMHVGMTLLSRDTGGLLLANSNDLSGAVDQVFADQAAFYLMGYVPTESHRRESEHGAGYHRIEVRVKRAGLRVRSRSGFYAPATSEFGPRSPDDQLFAAVTSPFSSPDLHLRLTPLFGLDPVRGPYVRSLVHLDAKDLLPTPRDDGSRALELRFLAIAFDSTGRPAGQTVRSQALNIAPNELAAVLRDGLVYVLDTPIGKAGPYTFKAAVREGASGRIGAASRFVDVPDTSKARVALSGIVLGASQAISDNSGRSEEHRAATSPAVRRFAPGSKLSYSLFVYNISANALDASAKFTIDVALYRDDTLIQSEPRRSLAESRIGAPDGLAVGGLLALSSDLAPGAYAVSVAIKRDGRSGVLARQWADFEIVDSKLAAETW